MDAGYPPNNWNDPVKSLIDTIAASPRDWSLSERDAWMYGIICGWEEAIWDVARKHRWSAETVARLQALHSELTKMTKPWTGAQRVE